MANIIGIDLGFRHTGVAVLDPLADQLTTLVCFHTKPDKSKQSLFVANDDVRSCQRMIAQLDELLQQCTFDFLVVELPVGGAQSSRAARAMGMASAMAATYVELRGYPTLWVTPSEVKFAATGSKQASKDEVKDAVQQRWAEAPWPRTRNDLEHIADAAGALLAARTSDLYRLTLRHAGVD